MSLAAKWQPECHLGWAGPQTKAWITGQGMQHILCGVAYCFQIPAPQAFGPPISSILHAKILDRVYLITIVMPEKPPKD